jgi:two-component system, NtrC family, sensor kinase
MTPNVAAHHIGSPHRRVLVVEDDADILESMSSILEDAGYRVDACVNGRDALDRLQEYPADAIVLDLMMPVMNGWEFVTAKKADPAIAEIPVVAISADSSAKATAIRADSYIPKPFHADDLVAAVGRVLLDADRRKLIQRLGETERLTVLGMIAAGVGHEINNPLALVTASIELIERTISSVCQTVRVASQARRDDRMIASIEPPLESIQEQLGDCRAALERVRLIVRELRSASRRAGNERKMIEVRSVLESAITMAWGELSPRIDVVRQYDPGLHVMGNEARLGQVFLNLLVNAAQAIPKENEGRGRVSVVARRQGAHAVIEIRDTGRGMSAVQIERIFEPFFTTKGQLGGTGLGLAICREIVEDHGGTIEVTSGLGGGSCFSVRLNAVSPDAD